MHSHMSSTLEVAKIVRDFNWSGTRGSNPRPPRWQHYKDKIPSACPGKEFPAISTSSKKKRGVRKEPSTNRPGQERTGTDRQSSSGCGKTAVRPDLTANWISTSISSVEYIYRKPRS